MVFERWIEKIINNHVDGERENVKHIRQAHQQTGNRRIKSNKDRDNIKIKYAL
jgi:hypothetical protein